MATKRPAKTRRISGGTLAAATEPFQEGSRVWGEWVAGAWFPGRVTEVSGPFRHVAFDDGDEGWLDAGRLVASPDAPESVLAIGQRVVAEWAPNVWFPGAIDQVRGEEYHVQFDDGDQGWYAPNKIRIGTGEMPALAVEPAHGARVHAQWKDGNLYAGVVTDAVGAEFRVDFDDGDVSTLPADRIRVRVAGGPDLPRGMRASTPFPGAQVLACSSPRAGWRVAAIESAHGPLIDVRFEDGARGQVTAPFVALLADEVRPSFPPEGAAILAEWVPGRWYTGEMGRVVGPRGYVTYDDGTRAWLTAYMIAALCG
jgi:hypothetical protein